MNGLIHGLRARAFGLRARALGLPDEAKGILLFVLAIVFFPSMDAIGKELSTRYDPFQVVWARYVGQAVLVAAALAPWLPRMLRTRHPGLQALRSAFLFLATLCFFTAFAHMPLADATAIFEVGPLLVTALAALVLREQVGPRRWTGVIVGFLGALIIIRPGTSAFQPVALLPMVGAFFFACYAISTRVLGRAESPWTTFLYTALLGAVAASLWAPRVWTTPTVGDAGIMLLMGAVGSVGQFLMIVAFGFARASVLAPFTYVGLLVATLWGVVWFGDVPDAWTVTGAAVIVGSGLYVWRRERIRKTA